MSKSALPALALAAVALAGSGCTRQLRLDRHISKGNSAFAAGKFDVAEIEYAKALFLAPNDPVLLGRLGVLYYTEGLMLPGYALLHQSLRDGATDPEVRLDYGLASLSIAKTAEARNSALKVLEVQPTNGEAMTLLAQASVTNAEVEQARHTLQDLRDRAGDSAGFHVALGSIQLGGGDEAGAEAEFKRAIALDPQSGAAYLGLAGIYELRRDFPRARAAYKTAADYSSLRAARRLKYIDFLERTGDWAEAKARLADINAQAPDFVPGWIYTMQLAYRQGRFSDCLQVAEKILGRDPVSYDALIVRAQVKLGQGDVDGAIAELKRMAGMFTTAPQVHLLLANAYMKKMDLAKAQESLNQALAIAPSYDQAILLMAELHLRKGYAADAISWLAPLVKRRPQLGRARLLLGQAYRALGDYDAALTTFRALAKALPGDPESPYLAGSTLLDLGRPQEARQSFIQSAKRVENYWPAQEAWVGLDLRGGRAERAGQRIEQLVQKYPAASQPLQFRAALRLARGDSAGAEADLLKAIELDPKSESAYMALARLYLGQSQAKLALEKLTALTAKIDSASALMQLGIVQTGLKRYEAARQTYERLVALNPDFVPGLNNLACLYADNLGDLDKAQFYARRARDLAPDDWIVGDTLGWVLYRKHDYDDALALLQESIVFNPSQPEVQYHLGMIHYMLDDEGPARTALQKAAGAGLADAGEIRRRLALLAIDPAKAGPAVRRQLEEQARQDPADPVLMARLAAIEQRDGDIPQAAAHYEAALRFNKHAVWIMLGLVDLYSGPLHDPDRARALAKSAHEAAPGDAQISLTLGRLLLGLGDYAWATTLLEEASRAFPNNIDLLNEMADAYYDTGHADTAESTLARIRDSDAASEAQKETAQRLSSMMRAAESPAQAEAELGEAKALLEKSPGYIPALMVAALGREQAGDYAAAGSQLESIRARDPLFAPATRRLAILYSERLGDDRKAEDLGMEARRTYPDDPDLNYELGAVNYRRGNYSAAAQFLGQSLRERDGDAQTVFYLGMSHYQLKATDQSKDELQRAIDLGLPPRQADQAKSVLERINRVEGNDDAPLAPGSR